MITGDMPDTLADCKLIGLDIDALVAGGAMRGKFEERLKSILKKVTKRDGEIILLINEMHTVIRVSVAQGSIDASNLLKPTLAKGESRYIGANAINNYMKFIEKDKALERRFQQVMIN